MMSEGKIYHIPAMLNECMDALAIRPDGTYIDVTFGGGGHSRAILERLGPNGQLYSFDQDLDAYQNRINDSRWHFVHGNFRYIKNFMDYYGITAVDGIIADLGVSFHHFDEAERGFSFRYAGPLDMRMNRQGRKTAADIVNNYEESELARVLWLYGEMTNSRALAARIVRHRSKNSITRIEHLLTAVGITTAELPDGTELSIDSRQKKDLARLMQALRIEVNDEMTALTEMLEGSKTLLKDGGRMVVLTYHSLEDRMVKNFFRSGRIDGTIEKDFYGNILSPFSVIEKGRTASEEEVERNPRARSAKMRSVMRVANEVIS